MADVKEFQRKPTPLEVKRENIVFFNIESNDSYDFDKLSPEAQAEVIQKNEMFEHDVIQRLLLDRAAPCQCQMPRVMERVNTKLRLGVIKPGPNGQIPMELLQEDVDTRQFGVIVTAHDGVYSNVNMVINKCKGCGDLHLYGDVEAITRMFAGAYARELEINMQRDASGVEDAIRQSMERGEQCVADADALGPNFVMENVETGERTGADDLGSALLGGSGSDDIKMEPVKETDQ